VEVLHAPMAMSAWFVEKLGSTCSLVFMPDAAHRPVDAKYARGETSLSDGFPYLIISQASLDDLNTRLDSHVPMNRFRPNLVIAGGTPFQEDTWTSITIGTARFNLVKPCSRCVITTTDQHTGQRGKEPLRTLATFRRNGERILFAVNAVADGHGTITAGDRVVPLAQHGS